MSMNHQEMIEFMTTMPVNLKLRMWTLSGVVECKRTPIFLSTNDRQTKTFHMCNRIKVMCPYCLRSMNLCVRLLDMVPHYHMQYNPSNAPHHVSTYQTILSPNRYGWAAFRPRAEGCNFYFMSAYFIWVGLIKDAIYFSANAGIMKEQPSVSIGTFGKCKYIQTDFP